MILISQLFPYILIAILPIALLFHPMRGARSVLFFTFGYFLTTFLYSLGLFEIYGTRYHPLIFASVITIILYHSLDITPHIFVAWVIELVLIGLNAGMIWNIGILPSLHWYASVALNFASLLILVGGWGHGNARILYHKRYSLDLPLGFIGGGYRVAHSESEKLGKAQSW